MWIVRAYTLLKIELSYLLFHCFSVVFWRYTSSVSSTQTDSGCASLSRNVLGRAITSEQAKRQGRFGIPVIVRLLPTFSGRESNTVVN